MIEINKPNITIGIPTYKRSSSLLKTLKSLNLQTYKKFKILVSVNGAGEEIVEYKKIESDLEGDLNIKFYFQNKNIGILNNHFYLLQKCKTEFFMWSADDDLISPSCLEDLLCLLKNNREAVTAVPNWELVNKNYKKKILTPSHFHQKNTLIRIINYCNISDDAFFHGLHKTKNLKKCSFLGFWKPNSNLIRRWAYVYLFDLVIQGKILFDPKLKAKWTNHDIEKKHYKKNSIHPIIGMFENHIKTININYLYLAKIIKWKKFYFLPIVFPLLVYFAIRDLLFGQKIYRKTTFD